MTKSFALKIACRKTKITDEDIQIIQHARKSLLFHNKQTWMKNNGNLFDVTIGAYDEAEVCELEGIYIQYQISQKYDIKNVGLYRDDGLAVFKIAKAWN